MNEQWRKMSPTMTWRSTALLTGATTLAAWLAAPAPAPVRSAGGSDAAPARTPRVSEIEAEADRLSARVQPSAPLVPPERNPFAFGAVRAPLRRPQVVEVPAAPVAAPAAPSIRLTGIATDLVDGATVRTAIFSSPDGLLFVREGETAAGLYRVTRVDEDGVEVTRIDDGATRRITF